MLIGRQTISPREEEQKEERGELYEISKIYFTQ